MKYKVGDKARVRFGDYKGIVLNVTEVDGGAYRLTNNRWYAEYALEPITDPLTEIKLELNGKPYSEILKELTEPLDLVKRHKKICEHLNKVYADKNHDYGNSFGETFEKYGDISALVRISDKMNRIDQLVQTGEQKVKDEALEDSILDMANYLIMWAMELEKSDIEQALDDLKNGNVNTFDSVEDLMNELEEEE